MDKRVRARLWSVKLSVSQHQVDALEKFHGQTCVNLGQSLQYVFIGGIERTEQSGDHVHCVYQFTHPRTWESVVSTFKLEDFKPYGRPGDKKREYFVLHHMKLDTKINPDVRMLFEYPADSQVYAACLKKTQWTPVDTMAVKSGKRKSTSNDKWADCIELTKLGKLEACEDCNKVDCCVYHKYPDVYVKNRNQLYGLNPVQVKPKGCVKLDHLWIYGPSGCGKTSSVYALFQQDGLYRRNIEQSFWQSYGNEPNVVIEDMNNSLMRQCQLTTLKNLADPTGFAVEQKYGNSEVIRPRIIITSQYTIDECVQYVGKNKKYNEDWYHPEDLVAIKRRYRCIHFNQWLRELNLKVVPDAKRQQLDLEHCDDPMKYLEPLDDSTGEVNHAGRNPFQHLQDKHDQAAQDLANSINNYALVSNETNIDGQGQFLETTFYVNVDQCKRFKSANGKGIVRLGNANGMNFKIKITPAGQDGLQQYSLRQTDSPLNSDDEADE